MKDKISIIGGDLRIVNLIKMLAEDGFEIYIYGLEKAKELYEVYDLKYCDNLKSTTKKSDIILSSIPLSQDGENVLAPFANENIKLEELYSNLKDKMFIAGRIDEKFKKINNIEVYDILEIEEYAILNAIATAEGAIQIAMEEYPKTLLGSNVLVMGFGRIGKILSKMLQGVGANVYCEARKNEDLAYIKGYGYTPIHLNDLNNYLAKFDIIINNIPVQILNKERLDLVNKDTLIIDLASKPGGVDFEYAKLKNIKTIWALALPGKVAPVSSSEYIRQTLYSILKK